MCSPYNNYGVDKKQVGTIDRDILSLSLLDHRNIVKLLGLSSTQTELIILMEKAASIKVFEYAEKIYSSWYATGAKESPPKPPTCWLRAFSELARGCAAMAGAGIRHRDLTLDNILVFISDKNIIEDD